MKTQNQTPEKNNSREVEKKQASASPKRSTDQQSDSRVKTSEKGRSVSDRETEKQDQKAKSNRDATKH